MSAEGSEEFDAILKEVNPRGKFQKKFFLLAVLPFVLFYPFNMHYMFLLGEPEHWCYVPGWEKTNLTLQEWKERTIPKLKDGSGFESCSQYVLGSGFSRVQNEDVTDCANGWIYSTDVYAETAVSSFDWVCDKKTMVATSFSLIYGAHLVSSVILSFIMDRYGRKLTYAITIFMFIVFGTGSLFCNSTWFLVLLFLKYFCHPIGYMAPFIWFTEMVIPEDRPKVELICEGSWATSLSTLAFIMWLCHGHWVYGGLASTLPFIVILICLLFVPDSVRWLASTGNIKQAEDIIKKIAKTNGKPVPSNLHERLEQSGESKDSQVSLLSLFKYRNQVIRMAITSLSSIAAYTVYYGIFMNLNKIPGDLYLNFFIISIMEIPGYSFGFWCICKIGRRASTFIFLVSSGVACIGIAVFSEHVSIGLIIFSILGKFTNGGLWVSRNMHTVEMFPTCCRSVANAPSAFFGQACNILLPWVLELHSVSPILPFVIIAVVPLITAPLVLFLPETHNQSLPQTVAEAENFGKDQKFWGLNLKSLS